MHRDKLNDKIGRTQVTFQWVTSSHIKHKYVNVVIISQIYIFKNKKIQTITLKKVILIKHLPISTTLSIEYIFLQIYSYHVL